MVLSTPEIDKYPSSFPNIYMQTIPLMSISFKQRRTLYKKMKMKFLWFININTWLHCVIHKVLKYIRLAIYWNYNILQSFRNSQNNIIKMHYIYSIIVSNTLKIYKYPPSLANIYMQTNSLMHILFKQRRTLYKKRKWVFMIY